jgi:hypothetical protein
MILRGSAGRICHLVNVKSYMSYLQQCTTIIKKSLKIPKGQSENVYRRTDNTMTKRKSTKGQTTIDKTYIKN